MIPTKERKNFAEYLSRQLDEEFPYDMARQNIDDNDWRIRKPATLDVVAAAKEFDQFSRTQTYRNTITATELLSNVPITPSQLTNALRSKYEMSDSECQDVLKQLNNSRAVNVHVNPYTKSVSFTKKMT